VSGAHFGRHGSVVLCSLQRSSEAKETVENRMRSLTPKEQSHIKLNNQCSTTDGSAPEDEFHASFALRIKNDRRLSDDGHVASKLRSAEVTRVLCVP
jgi:hypothetical protein